LSLDSIKERIGAAKAGDLASRIGTEADLGVEMQNDLEHSCRLGVHLPEKWGPEKSEQLALTLTHGFTLMPEAHGLSRLPPHWRF